MTELVSVDSDVGALHVGAAAESSLASTFELKTIVCQDRLGTKYLGKERHCLLLRAFCPLLQASLRSSVAGSRRRWPRWGAPLLCFSQCIFPNEKRWWFTKTGSGQTCVD